MRASRSVRAAAGMFHAVCLGVVTAFQSLAIDKMLSRLAGSQSDR
jgi:hypothetical protein